MHSLQYLISTGNILWFPLRYIPFEEDFTYYRFYIIDFTYSLIYYVLTNWICSNCTYIHIYSFITNFEYVLWLHFLTLIISMRLYVLQMESLNRMLCMSNSDYSNNFVFNKEFLCCLLRARFTFYWYTLSYIFRSNFY